VGRATLSREGKVLKPLVVISKESTFIGRVCKEYAVGCARQSRRDLALALSEKNFFA